MSFIPLSEVKAFLKVIHHFDDAEILGLLNGAEDEALQFMGRAAFAEFTTSSFEGIPDSVRTAIYLLLQASYQAKPEEISTYRHAAEVKLMPYRIGMGI